MRARGTPGFRASSRRGEPAWQARPGRDHETGTPGGRSDRSPASSGLVHRRAPCRRPAPRPRRASPPAAPRSPQLPGRQRCAQPAARHPASDRPARWPAGSCRPCGTGHQPQPPGVGRRGAMPPAPSYGAPNRPPRGADPQAAPGSAGSAFPNRAPPAACLATRPRSPSDNDGASAPVTAPVTAPPAAHGPPARTKAPAAPAPARPAPQAKGSQRDLRLICSSSPLARQTCSVAPGKLTPTLTPAVLKTANPVRLTCADCLVGEVVGIHLARSREWLVCRGGSRAQQD
jgi:hypothetical protein